MQRSFRKLKRALERLFCDSFEAGMREVERHAARVVINPLFSLFYHGDERVRWFAVTAAGRVICRLADEEIESARVLMRRLMWNLNDESGGIGWGSPEAMGLAVAGNPRLSAEYGCILFSYLLPEGNYLEHPLLQRGVLWGAARAARAGVSGGPRVAAVVTTFLGSQDPCLRGLAAWFLAAAPSPEAVSLLKALRSDRSRFSLFDDLTLTVTTVGQMARSALADPQK